MKVGLGTILRLVVVVGIVAGLLWERHATEGAIAAISVVVNGTSRPPPPADTSAQRLLPQVAGPLGQGGYTFAETQGAAGGPVTYDPCRPIHVVISLEDAPSNAVAVVQSALATVRADTGLAFTVEGTTSEVAQPKRPFVDRARYGDRWSPVLVAFTTPQRVSALDGNIAGVGGSARFSNGGPEAYVTGIV
ncbi:MAG: hypothetical protein ABI131_09805, partial [Nostocoides sp.]